MGFSRRERSMSLSGAIPSIEETAHNSRTDRRPSWSVAGLTVPGVSAAQDIGLIVCFVCPPARMASPAVTLCNCYEFMRLSRRHGEPFPC